MAGTKGVDQAYLAAEAKARVEIDQQLEACGWLVQDRAELNLYAGQGIAVREFTMAEDHGRADYLLFVDRQAVGTIEAKPKGCQGCRRWCFAHAKTCRSGIAGRLELLHG